KRALLAARQFRDDAGRHDFPPPFGGTGALDPSGGTAAFAGSDGRGGAVAAAAGVAAAGGEAGAGAVIAGLSIDASAMGEGCGNGFNCAPRSKISPGPG